MTPTRPTCGERTQVSNDQIAVTCSVVQRDETGRALIPEEVRPTLIPRVLAN